MLKYIDTFLIVNCTVSAVGYYQTRNVPSEDFKYSNVNKTFKIVDFKNVSSILFRLAFRTVQYEKRSCHELYLYQFMLIKFKVNISLRAQ